MRTLTALRESGRWQGRRWGLRWRFASGPVVTAINLPLMLWNARPIALKMWKVLSREHRLNVDFLDILAIGVCLFQGAFCDGGNHYLAGAARRLDPRTDGCPFQARGGAICWNSRRRWHGCCEVR
jgi:hypothetical protein